MRLLKYKTNGISLGKQRGWIRISGTDKLAERTSAEILLVSSLVRCCIQRTNADDQLMLGLVIESPAQVISFFEKTSRRCDCGLTSV